ncbi:hypothetical protein [Kitasatospora purpeofusca]|uniref:hypothetical protein n=1 Tax=Kitasatospora purpeofusca TaxID=67352 RepID=UPI0036D3CC55
MGGVALLAGGCLVSAASVAAGAPYPLLAVGLLGAGFGVSFALPALVPALVPAAPEGAALLLPAVACAAAGLPLARRPGAR